jgi:hypothetical protein
MDSLSNFWKMISGERQRLLLEEIIKIEDYEEKYGMKIGFDSKDVVEEFAKVLDPYLNLDPGLLRFSPKFKMSCHEFEKCRKLERYVDLMQNKIPEGSALIYHIEPTDDEPYVCTIELVVK